MFIGVDIGGTKILVGAGDAKPTIIRSQKIATPKDGSQGVTEIIRLIEQVAGDDPIEGISLACAGPLDRHKGVITRTSPNMHGWRNTELTGPIKNHFKLPVTINLDPVAAAITEHRIGVAQNEPYVLYITISTGIGVSLLINGKPYQGVHNLEAGHIIIDPDGPPCGCGGRGHFESLCAGPAITKRYGKPAYEITDPGIWDEIAGNMALGFHSLIEAYSPSVVVTGGGVGGVHFDQFHGSLVKHLERLTPMFDLPPIVPAKYTETAVLYGALILAAHPGQPA